MSKAEEIKARARTRQELCRRVKEVIVRRLELEINPDWISDDQALFGRGLELDSIDALELAVGLEEEFGVAISDDNMDVFGSINKLVDYILEQGGGQEVERVEDAFEG